MQNYLSKGIRWMGIGRDMIELNPLKPIRIFRIIKSCEGTSVRFVAHVVKTIIRGTFNLFHAMIRNQKVFLKHENDIMQISLPSTAGK